MERASSRAIAATEAVTETILVQFDAPPNPQDLMLAGSRERSRRAPRNGLKVFHSRLGSADQRGHVALGGSILEHQLMAVADLLESEGLSEARIDLTFAHELVERVGLLVVGEVRSLKALLPHPEVAQIDRGVVARMSRAYHDHPAGVAHEHGGRDGVLAGEFEDDPGIAPFAYDVPDGLAERPRLRDPRRERRIILPMGKHPPVLEVLAVYTAFGAELPAEFYFPIIADDPDRNAAFGLHDLNRHRAESARCAPDEHHVAFADGVRRPSHQHPVCGGTDECGSGGFLPGEVPGLGHALMRLDLGELREASPVGLVAPDLERGVVHGVVAVAHGRTIPVPYAAVDHHPVSDLDVGDILANGINDSGGVASSDMEIGIVVAGFLACRYDVDWRTERGPYVVVVDSGGHHEDQDLVRLQFRHGDPLDPERAFGVPETVSANQLTVHVPGHMTDRRYLADFVDFPLAHILPLAIALCPVGPVVRSSQLGFPGYLPVLHRGGCTFGKKLPRVDSFPFETPKRRNLSYRFGKALTTG